jgi:hypothetical protein
MTQIAERTLLPTVLLLLHVDLFLQEHVFLTTAYHKPLFIIQHKESSLKIEKLEECDCDEHTMHKPFLSWRGGGEKYASTEEIRLKSLPAINYNKRMG